MRRFFLAVVCLVVALPPPGITNAQAPSQQPFFIRDLGSGVWAAITNPDAKAGSVANAGFVIGDDGVIVIDTAPNAGKALSAEIPIMLLTTAYSPRPAPPCWRTAMCAGGFIRRI